MFKIDLWASYHQIWMHEKETPKTRFRPQHEYYKFLVIPFRLTNIPATIQCAVNVVLHLSLWKSVLVFFFNIFVCGRTCEARLTQVLSTLRKKNAATICKSAGSGSRVTVLDSQSHHIQGRVTMDPCKVNSNLSWLVPRTVKDLWWIIGLDMLKSAVCT